MKGINKVILVGTLGKDPEVKYMPSGKAVANIGIATSMQWKDQQGQKQEKTEWHQVVFFDRLGEIVGEYLKKGSKVYVEGRLQTRKWQDQSGNDRYSTEVVANEMQMLDSRDQSSGQQSQGNNQTQRPQQRQAQNQQQGYQSQANNQTRQNNQSPQQSNQPQNQSQGAGTYDNFEDEIPF